MKNVMIDQELFLDLIRYFCFGQTDKEISITERLADKLNKVAAREYYNMYLTAKSPEEKRDAMNKYLDTKGVPEDFRF